MEILNYALIALIASTGLILGRILAWTAKEEIKPGTKYFILIQKALFCIITAIIMYANRTNVHYIWTGALIIFAYLSLFKKINHLIVSAVLAFGFYLGSKTDYFLLISALTFLYGLPAGSLLKDKKKLAINVAVFLALSILPFLF